MKEKKEKKKNKRNKIDEYDDGRTIIEMNVEGMPWYSGNPRGEKADKKDHDKPTRRELFKMIFGLYKAMIPYLLIALACFTAIFVAMYFALKSTL